MLTSKYTAPSEGEYDTKNKWLSVKSLSSTCSWYTVDPIVIPSNTDTVWGRFLNSGGEFISEKKFRKQNLYRSHTVYILHDMQRKINKTPFSGKSCSFQLKYSFITRTREDLQIGTTVSRLYILIAPSAFSNV